MALMTIAAKPGTGWRSALAKPLAHAAILGAYCMALGSCGLANAEKIDRKKWVLTFSEEFDRAPSFWDAAANPKGRWKTNYFFGVQDINHEQGWESRTLAPNKELQFYGDARDGTSPFVWKNGILDIVAQPNPDKDDPRTHNLPYLSGLITTEKSFALQTGYFEARIAIPVGKGLWPAFWLLPTPVTQANGWPKGRGHQEIDIMEVVGQQGTFHATAINDVNGEKVTNQEAIETGADLTQFHTYGLMLTKTDIVWYFDDVEVRRVPNRDFHFPAYMLLNLAVGGEWPGSPDSTTHFPAHMRIDWVRAYSPK